MPNKDPEKKKATDALWRSRHREEIRIKNAARRAAHREEAKAISKAWRAAHPEEKKAQDAAYLAAHREENKTRCKARWASLSPIERARESDRSYRHYVERRLERMEKEMQSWHKDT